MIKDTLAELSELMSEIQKENQRYLDELVVSTPYETKLAVAAWVIENIVKHGEEGGSFRHLIYDRLGFNEDAYVPLYEAGGMTITNEFDLDFKNRLREHVIENKIESMKKFFGLCDEPSCFEHAGSGWPSDDGYRWTCSNHYEGKLKKNAE